MVKQILAVLALLGCLHPGLGYLIGTGIADCTGLVAEGLLYGYAELDHTARGLHLRQYSRAYIIDDADDVISKRAIYVIADITMVTHALRQGVLERLAELYGDLYTEQNVMLSGTHTHAAPGGYFTYWIYQFISGGWANDTYNAYVDGIIQSIQAAHDNLQEGRILINTGIVPNAGRNRSPASYDNNPEEERERYDDNVDHEMTLLKFVADTGEDLGALSFLAVHQTSMKSDSYLVSSDNKGFASIRFELEMNPGYHPGQGSFVAGFANTNEGDVTPDVQGATCTDTGEPCDYVTSTCPSNPNDPGLCVSKGPTGDQFLDTSIIGERQYRVAKALFDNATEEVVGPVGFAHQWVNASDLTVTFNGSEARTCRPAMGFSFAAGIPDGPGIPPFTQGDTEGIPGISDLIDLVFPFSEEMKECQEPKPVLLPSGEMENPWEWQPEVNPVQIIKFGSVVLVGLPGEFTTMSGRRIRDAISGVMSDNGVEGPLYIQPISLTNEYASYITTYEEYQIQRYEGASTLNGPHTLQGYLQELETLAEVVAQDGEVTPNPPPPDLRGLPEEALDDVRIDEVPVGTAYGDVIVDALPAYQQGETVSVTFLSGNPRLTHQSGQSYLEVQKLEADTWLVDKNDAYWETRFYWDSDCVDAGVVNLRCRSRQSSNVTVTWDIQLSQSEGTYRIVHYGSAQTRTEVVPYVGTSSSFLVISVGGRRQSMGNASWNTKIDL